MMNCELMICQPEQAIASFLENLSIARANGDRRKESHCLNNLGTAFNALGNSAKAIYCFKRALNVVERTDDHAEEASILINLGNAYIQLMQYYRASQFYQQASEVAREMDDELLLHSVILHNLKLAEDCYAQTGL